MFSERMSKKAESGLEWDVKRSHQLLQLLLLPMSMSYVPVLDVVSDLRSRKMQSCVYTK